MNKDVAIALSFKAEEAAKAFSDPNREFNTQKETFAIEEIVPLGDELAIVKMRKSSGKVALMVFVYIKNYWIYFFPKSGHLLGWERIKDAYFEVERENFSKNFETKLVDYA